MFEEDRKISGLLHSEDFKLHSSVRKLQSHPKIIKCTVKLIESCLRNEYSKNEPGSINNNDDDDNDNEKFTRP